MPNEALEQWKEAQPVHRGMQKQRSMQKRRHYAEKRAFCRLAKLWSSRIEDRKTLLHTRTKVLNEATVMLIAFVLPEAPLSR